MATIWKLNAEPEVPLAVLALVIVGALSDTVNTNSFVSVPVALVAEIITLTGPPMTTTGVPEMTPVMVLIDRPPGKPVALKLAGRLLAVIVYV